MDGALLVHRLQFAFTVTLHYLFPQLTMDLAPLIVTGRHSNLSEAARVNVGKNYRAKGALCQETADA
jgi:hypothetical protein